MENALIVTSSEKSVAYLANFLTEAAIPNISVAANAGEARRMLVEQDFDLCIINAPLSDEFGERLAQRVAETSFSEVIMLVKSDYFNEISDKVEDYGVITVAKPIHRLLLWDALKLVQAAHKRLLSIQQQNKKLLQKIEDIRIIDRAKCILISHFSMTEPEAHRYIEKQSMDIRLTRREVAEEIIRTYEN